jgi:hypothetical protein
MEALSDAPGGETLEKSGDPGLILGLPGSDVDPPVIAHQDPLASLRVHRIPVHGDDGDVAVIR